MSPETTDLATTVTETNGTAAARATPTTGEMIFNIAVFGASTAASLAFAYYLFADPSQLTELWQWIRALPLLVQLVMWALLLPWMLALWIWSTPWAFAIRLVLVVSVLLFTEYLVFPWRP